MAVKREPVQRLGVGHRWQRDIQLGKQVREVKRFNVQITGYLHWQLLILHIADNAQTFTVGYGWCRTDFQALDVVVAGFRGNGHIAIDLGVHGQLRDSNPGLELKREGLPHGNGTGGQTGV